MYSKNLIEANDEVSQLRRNFKQASLQIHQLKEDIETKDQAVTQISFDKAELEKKIEFKISKLSQVTLEKEFEEKKAQQLAN